MPAFRSLSRIRRPLALLTCSLAATLAHAQALPPSVQLGMTAPELQAAVPDLERVARPERMANGARGLWRQEGLVGDSGSSFDVIYFFRGSALDRIDMSLLPESGLGPAAQFERVVDSLRDMFGKELRTHASTASMLQEAASWVSGDQDVAVYLMGPPDAARVHVIYRQRELKDGSTL